MGALGVRDSGDVCLQIRTDMDAEFVPALALAIRECGLACGLRATASDDLQMAARVVFELITHINDPADPGERPERLTVEVRHRRGGVTVRIDDRGIPYELFEVAHRVASWRQMDGAAGNDLIGLVNTLVDGVHFQPRGREGNRIELFKRFRRRSALQATIAPES